jgi:hypothetical protein
MNILGIDPGNTRSAYCVYNTDTQTILEYGIKENQGLLEDLKYLCVVDDVHVFIEMVASYGMTVGKEVFDTVFWIGRFYQKLKDEEINNVELIYRKEVKLVLCNDLRAKDKNIRQACLDRLGKEKCKGIAKDMWSALAICLTVESINNLHDWKLLKERLP